MARKSYFEEKRGQYSDPNYFNKPQAVEDIAQNVKRIVRDVWFGMISDNDFNYFMSPNIINTCVATSYKYYVEANTISNSLMFYIQNGLNKGYTPLGGVLNQELTLACSEQARFGQRAYMWLAIYQLFYAITMGADIRQQLDQIKSFSKQAILDM